MDLQQQLLQRRRATEFAHDHLAELARDILAWRSTGKLGERTRLRQLGKLMPKTERDFPLQDAERLVETLALQQLAGPKPAHVPYDPTPGPEREVGINPIPGDIVHVTAKCRHVVTEVRDDIVYYTDYDDGTALADYVLLERWRRWHRNTPKPVTKAEELAGGMK